MGRQNEVSLPYFELDCHMDDKIKLIRAEYGLKGFAIVVMMYQRIYGGDYGYYCEWDDERLLLFMSDNGLIGESKNLINEVVRACIRRDIFSDRLYKEYGILTSSGVQKQYLKATAKRQVVNLKKEYLLISIPKNRSNVVINSISYGRKEIDDGINSQSNSKSNSKSNKNNMCKAEAVALFDKLWKLYPVKRGKGRVSDTKKLTLLNIGFEEMCRAIERYKQHVDSVDYLQYQNGSTFFNSGYVDYLDANYEKVAQKKKETNGFNNFSQRKYDYDELENRLLRRTYGGG